MKKKLLAIPVLVLLVTCVAMLFTACGGGMDASVYTEDKSVVYTADGSKVIEGVDGYGYVDTNNSSLSEMLGVYGSSNNLVAFAKEVEPETAPDFTAATWSYTSNLKLSVYNVTADGKFDLPDTTFTLSFADNKTTLSTYKKSQVQLFDEYFAVIKTDVKSATKDGNIQSVYQFLDETAEFNSLTVDIYNLDFESIYSLNCNYDDFSGVEAVAKGDKILGFVIENNFYRLKDGEITDVVEDYQNCALNVENIDSSSEIHGDYYFVETSDAVRVYDLDTLALENYYVIPSYFSDYELIYLSNGNFIIQALYTADFMADDYDFIESSAKYYFDTLLVKTNGSVKELDCEYWIDDVIYTELQGDNYYSNYEVIAYVALKIENKRTVEIDTIKVGINGDGKFTEIDSIVDYQNESKGVTKRADGSFKVEDIFGFIYFYDKDGDLVKSIKASNYVEAGNYYVNASSGKFMNKYTFVESELPEGYIPLGVDGSNPNAPLKQVLSGSVKGGELIIVKTETLKNADESEYTKTTTAKFIDGEAVELYAEYSATYQTTAVLPDYIQDFASNCFVKIYVGDAGAMKIELYDYSGVLLETINNVAAPVDAGDIVTVGDYKLVEVAVLTGNTTNPTETKTVYYRLGA